ncbi:MAG: hypothetical protein AAF799_39310 [Myxococcota bacterium]
MRLSTTAFLCGALSLGAARVAEAAPASEAGAEAPAEPREAESTPFVIFNPGALQAPWGFHTNYQWGLSAGYWFPGRGTTSHVGGYFGHVLGWRDSHIFRAGLEASVGRRFNHDLYEVFMATRVGYTGLVYSGRTQHGGNAGVALGLDIAPGPRRQFLVGTAVGLDFDFFAHFYLYPIVTWRLRIGLRLPS